MAQGKIFFLYITANMLPVNYTSKSPENRIINQIRDFDLGLLGDLYDEFQKILS